MHVEGYDGLLADDAQARRRERGLPPEPELVPFSRESPPLDELWRQLRARHPDGLIVCEGGPTVLGLVVEHGLLDQLVLCVSPKIVGDDLQKRVLDHGAPLDVNLRLLAVAYPVLVFFTITGTANHYILDSLAGGLVVAIGFIAVWAWMSARGSFHPAGARIRRTR